MMPTSKKKKEKKEKEEKEEQEKCTLPQAVCFLSALQLCLRVVYIPDDIIYNASAQTVNKKSRSFWASRQN